MKTRLFVILSLAALIVFTFGITARGQNEVTESLTTSYYGTSKSQPMGPDSMYATWESFGVTLNDTGQGLFHNVTIRCIGAYLAGKENWDGQGYCTFTMRDGDKVFLSVKHGGKTGMPPPPAKGTTKLLGGTGKYSGIQGGSEFVQIMLRPPFEGASHSYNKAKMTYKLP